MKLKSTAWFLAALMCGAAVAGVTGRDGHPLVSFYFDPVSRTPLHLDEADAKALAAALNRAR